MYRCVVTIWSIMNRRRRCRCADPGVAHRQPLTCPVCNVEGESSSVTAQSLNAVAVRRLRQVRTAPIPKREGSRLAGGKESGNWKRKWVRSGTFKAASAYRGNLYNNSTTRKYRKQCPGKEPTEQWPRDLNSNKFLTAAPDRRDWCLWRPRASPTAT